MSYDSITIIIPKVSLKQPEILSPDICKICEWARINDCMDNPNVTLEEFRECI